MNHTGSVKRFDDVIVMPLDGGKAGVYHHGTVIDETLLARHYGPVHQSAALAPATERIDREVLFGGYLQDHFGHFLLESLARLWFARERSELPIVWIGSTQYRRWQIEILDLLGVGNPPIFISKPTSIQRLVVPKSGYVVQTRFEPWHARFLGVFPAAPMTAGKKIWLSRAKLPETYGNVIGQAEIEGRLPALGWRIFHPQDFSIVDQLRCIADAERIAGIAGSAFHSVVLMKSLRARIDIFVRGARNLNYSTIARMKGLDQREHAIPAIRVSAGPQNHLSKFKWPSLDPVFEALT